MQAVCSMLVVAHTSTLFFKNRQDDAKILFHRALCVDLKFPESCFSFFPITFSLTLFSLPQTSLFARNTTAAWSSSTETSTSTSAPWSLVSSPRRWRHDVAVTAAVRAETAPAEAAEAASTATGPTTTATGASAAPATATGSRSTSPRSE